jgi:hypothetical protein
MRENSHELRASARLLALASPPYGSEHNRLQESPSPQQRTNDNVAWAKTPTWVYSDVQRWYEGWTGSPRPQGQGAHVSLSEVDAPSLVLFFVFAILIVSFGTGETHVPFIDAIFTEILLA